MHESSQQVNFLLSLQVSNSCPQTYTRLVLVSCSCCPSTSQYVFDKIGTYSVTQATKLVEEVITPDEEALVYWTFMMEEDVWMKEFWAKIDYMKSHPQNFSPVRKKTKGTGAHNSRVGAPLFKKLVERIKESREEGDWDKALRDLAKERREIFFEEQKEKQGKSSGSDDMAEMDLDRFQKAKQKKREEEVAQHFDWGPVERMDTV